jgi:magnesium chelatase family protein
MARERQRERLAGSGVFANAGMDGRLTQRHVRLGRDASRRLHASQRRTALTARGHDRVLRLARTIADLAGRERIMRVDIDEALGYRLNVPTLVAA